MSQHNVEQVIPHSVPNLVCFWVFVPSTFIAVPPVGASPSMKWVKGRETPSAAYQTVTQSNMSKALPNNMHAQNTHHVIHMTHTQLFVLPFLLVVRVQCSTTYFR